MYLIATPFPTTFRTFLKRQVALLSALRRERSPLLIRPRCC